MGTAFAMHAAREGADIALWATPMDEVALAAMRADGRHPGLPSHLPDGLVPHGPDQIDGAAEGCRVAVMAASSAGARSLARMVRDALGEATHVVSLAKGLEDGTTRISEVYAQELPGPMVVAVGGPCLAAELAEGLPSAAVWASADASDAQAASIGLDGPRYQVAVTDDVVGVEYCAVMKNVAAIGVGILDGIGRVDGREYHNARAALLSRALVELAVLIEVVGGRRETAQGLAGLGDVLVTSIGGRNRRFGEMVGAGGDPSQVLEELWGRGMTIEGVESARAVHRAAERSGTPLPYHAAVYRVLFEHADPTTVLEVLR
jgi:glycerol-3-phosphate dehydrogenase (NAD(P)+)